MCVCVCVGAVRWSVCVCVCVGAVRWCVSMRVCMCWHGELVCGCQEGELINPMITLMRSQAENCRKPFISCLIPSPWLSVPPPALRASEHHHSAGLQASSSCPRRGSGRPSQIQFLQTVHKSSEGCLWSTVALGTTESIQLMKKLTVPGYDE